MYVSRSAYGRSISRFPPSACRLHGRCCGKVNAGMRPALSSKHTDIENRYLVFPRQPGESPALCPGTFQSCAACLATSEPLRGRARQDHIHRIGSYFYQTN